MEADLVAYRRISAARADQLDAIETSPAAVIAVEADYSDTRLVPAHWHSRSQLMHALCGLMLVATERGRWLVPRGHALWMPAGVVHEVGMQGGVRLRSAYLRPEAGGWPGVRTVAVSPLLAALMAEAVQFAPDAEGGREALVLDLIRHEIPRLQERPLALPLPRDPRLAALCQGFLAAPSARAAIDDWAERAGMSRRSFTRHFQAETGLSLARWRQQASLFAALPRLAGGEPVTGVALDLGYESVAAFTTMFRRMLGSAPRAWASGQQT